MVEGVFDVVFPKIGYTLGVILANQFKICSREREQLDKGDRSRGVGAEKVWAIEEQVFLAPDGTSNAHH